MKHLSMIGGFLGLAAGLSLLGASGVFAATQKTPQISPKGPTGTFNIIFNGYCDGMQITLPGSAGAPGAQAVRTGCGSGSLYGVGGARGVGLADATNQEFVVIRMGPVHTWFYYKDCGSGTECLFNSGTWSFGTPQAPQGRGGRASTAGPGGGLFGPAQSGFRAAQQTPQPQASTFNISFDGYCDGMQLNVPGSAGVPGADGVRTGCESDPVIGATDLGLVAMWDYTENFFYSISPDNTFIIYDDCGDGTECYNNSGTWSFGMPAAPGDQRPATPSSLQH